MSHIDNRLLDAISNDSHGKMRECVWVSAECSSVVQWINFFNALWDNSANEIIHFLNYRVSDSTFWQILLPHFCISLNEQVKYALTYFLSAFFFE